MRFLESLVPLLLSLGSAMAAPGADSTAHALVRRNYTTEYADELVDGTACRDVTVIYARGTGQQGNIGESTDVGPLFFDDLAALVPSFAAQGVNYSANVLGFEEGGDPTGSALMANLATLAYTQCPDTQLVLSGYSQGGQLVHKAAKQISSDVSNFVATVLIFGDPDNGEAVGDIPDDEVHVICHPLDGICLHTGVITSAHLDYQDDAPAAAQWVSTYLGY